MFVATRCSPMGLAYAVVSPAPTVLWAAQWRTTGTGQAHVGDGGRFNAGSFGGSVVAAVSLPDWPTANALRVPSATGEGWAMPQKTNLAAQGIGETRYYRVYLNIQVPDDSSDPASHPLQDGNAASDTSWMVEVYHDVAATNGLWRLSFWPGNGTQSVAANQRWTALTNLTKGATYRVEWSVTRTGTATMELHARVYNGAGTLVLGDSDFVSSDGAGNTSFADNTALEIDGTAALGTWLNAGLNQSEWTGAGTVYGYQGALAISASGWCGPYNAAAEASV